MTASRERLPKCLWRVAAGQRIDLKPENHRPSARLSACLLLATSVKARVCIEPAGKADPFTGANCNFKAIESTDNARRRCTHGRVRENCGRSLTREWPTFCLINNYGLISIGTRRVVKLSRWRRGMKRIILRREHGLR